jgi:hypothetical protein
MNLSGKIDIIPRACSGPNGPSSLLYSHFDAVALTQRPQLLDALHDLACRIDSITKGEPESHISAYYTAEQRTWKRGSSPETKDIPGNDDPELWNRGLKQWVTRLSNWANQNLSIQGKVPIGRLALLAEGGCKTRTIAIGDCFSQAVLRPIHDKLMHQLKKLPQDCTFDQTKAIKWLSKVTKDRRSVYSFDLTNATDRFPVILQEAVVGALFGTKVGQLWKDVMTTYRDFSLKKSKHHTLHGIHYAVGQGMGLYSSWPAFAYSHHILIQWCASEVGIESFTDYVIIGDDVAIANELVARKYRDILSELGVKISTAKSIISTKYPYCGEIAKRLILDGIDISPIPPDIIKQASKHVTMLPALLDEVSRRYGLDYSTLSSLLTLSRNFSRSWDRQKADILLTAPLAFARSGGHPLYGDLVSTCGEVPTIGEPSDNIDLTVKPDLIWDSSPWSKLDTLTLSGLNVVQEAVRKQFLLTQYDDIMGTIDTWLSHELMVPIIPGSRQDKTAKPPDAQHPYFKALAWLRKRFTADFSRRQEFIDCEDETLFKEMDLRYCLDPTMRSYQNLKQNRSNISSHLTLKVYKILMGDQPLPQFGESSKALTGVVHYFFAKG